MLRRWNKIERVWMRASESPQGRRQNNRRMAKERLAPPHVHLRPISSWARS